MKLSDPEKLILTMLCEIHAHLKIENGVDPTWILAALHEGRLSSLRDKYPGIFEASETPDEVVREVNDILWMWHLVERDFAVLGTDVQDQVLKDAEADAHDVQFPGFDGNNESDHLNAARFELEHLGKFERFRGRGLNSHAPMLGAYRRMVAAFKATSLNEGRMGPRHIAGVLKARRAR